MSRRPAESASPRARSIPWRRSRLPLRFHLELLEDRSLPSAFSGINPAGSLIYQDADAGVAGAVSQVYLADFETGAQGFTVNNAPPNDFYLPGQWHLSTGRGAQPGHSASTSFYYGSGEGPNGGGTYSLGVFEPTRGTITSPAINLPTGGPLKLTFNYVLETRVFPPDVDFATLEVNDGGGWTALQSYNGVAESSTWTTSAPVDLTAYAGETVQLRWSFDTIRGPVGRFPEGWYVDDVRITTLVPDAPDTFTISVDPGQTITVVVNPDDATLQPKVTLLAGATGKNVVGTATASAAGEPAVIQTVGVPGQIAGTGAAQTYRIVIEGANGTLGEYSFDTDLNAAVEGESHGGASNDTRATAQDITGSFVQLHSAGSSGTQPARGAVLGTADGASTVLTPIFVTDFEGGTDGFTVDNYLDGLWHLSTGRGAQPGHSQTHSFYYGQGEGPDGGGNYDTGDTNAGALISPFITLPDSAGVAVDFNYVLQTEGGTPFDLAQLQLSVNVGSGWQTLQSYNALAESSVWTTAAPVDLSAFAGETIQLRWVFDTVDSLFNGFEGWYVDDVRILAPQPDVYAFQLQAGASATVVATPLSGGATGVVLQNAAGVTVASGAGLNDYVAPATGTYYAVVTGQAGADYSLVVTRNAGFDTEGNNDIASAQPVLATPVAGRQWVLGNLELPSPNLINNGSFETGDFTGWTVATSGPPFVDWMVSGAGAGSGFFPPTSPQDGDYVAWNGFDGGGPMQFNMFQDVAIPADAPSATLSWQERVQWDFALTGSATQPRTYEVLVQDPGTGTTLGTLYSFSTGIAHVVGDTGWQTHAADLSAYIGTTVRLRFREAIPEPFTGPGQIEFDAISLDFPRAGRDFYRVTLSEGQPLEVETATPGGGAGEFVNLLDPAIRVYDSAGVLVASNDNGASDGRNARLAYKVPKGGAGAYFIEVTASDATAGFSSGEYILSIKGNVGGTASASGASLAGASAGNGPVNKSAAAPALLASGGFLPPTTATPDRADAEDPLGWLIPIYADTAGDPDDPALIGTRSKSAALTALSVVAEGGSSPDADRGFDDLKL